MHSGGLELTQLTYNIHEDNLLHHRGDRSNPNPTVSLWGARGCMVCQVISSNVSWGVGRGKASLDQSDTTVVVLHFWKEMCRNLERWCCN